MNRSFVSGVASKARRSPWLSKLTMFAAVAAAASVGTAWAGSGAPHAKRSAEETHRQLLPVLSASARPFGYSLDDMARLVAPFNISDRSGPPPNSPFQILYLNNVTQATSFDMAAGKMLYVPMIYNDDGPPIIGHFPSNAQDRPSMLRYWYSQSELGVTTMELVVDGKRVPLGAGYVSGVSFTPPLADGASQYLTAGAFIAPLARGAHTVGIRFKATGDALRIPPFDQWFTDGVWEFSIVYTVNVQ